MNVQHFQAFVWLRWRIRKHQLARGGIVSAVLLGLIAVGSAIAAVGLFVAGLLVGLLALPEIPAPARLYLWDGIVIGFGFMWMTGLMVDLQRTEALSLERFLHLPVSPVGAFLINYLSSLFSFTLLLFVPAVLGLALGQVFGLGALSVLLLPLLAAFLLAVTALTYQFQGWLASLMSNPRRRRTVIVVVTMGFVLLAQAPTLLSSAFGRHVSADNDVFVKQIQKQQDLNTWFGEQQGDILQARQRKTITEPEAQRRQAELSQQFKDRLAEISKESNELAGARSRDRSSQIERTAEILNLALPPGWLALGAAGLGNGNVVPALLATIAFTLIGVASLWRGYRTTLRMYTGQIGTGESRTVRSATAVTTSTRVRMIEWRLPWISEQASAVATAALRSLIRAPEAKMMLLSPLILVVVFGSIALTMRATVPESLRPLMASGAASFVLLMGVQLVGNQFGYDRGGFRVYVLSPAPRRDILLGKNIAAAPLTLGLGALLVLLVECLYPMRVDHLAVVLLQLTSMYLVFCLMANALSIYAPIPLAPGAMQPATIRGVPVLLHMAFIMVFPLVLLPTLFPLGLELLLAEFADIRGFPIALPLSALMLAIVVAIYRRLLTWEGNLLATRERDIVQVVTSKAE